MKATCQIRQHAPSCRHPRRPRRARRPPPAILGKARRRRPIRGSAAGRGVATRDGGGQSEGGLQGESAGLRKLLGRWGGALSRGTERGLQEGTAGPVGGSRAELRGGAGLARLAWATSSSAASPPSSSCTACEISYSSSARESLGPVGSGCARGGRRKQHRSGGDANNTAVARKQHGTRASGSRSTNRTSICTRLVGACTAGAGCGARPVLGVAGEASGGCAACAAAAGRPRLSAARARASAHPLLGSLVEADLAHVPRGRALDARVGRRRDAAVGTAHVTKVRSAARLERVRVEAGDEHFSRPARREHLARLSLLRILLRLVLALLARRRQRGGGTAHATVLWLVCRHNRRCGWWSVRRAG